MKVDLVVLQWIQEANLARMENYKQRQIHQLEIPFSLLFCHDQLSVSAIFVVHASICLVKPNPNVNMDTDLVVTQLVKFQW